jgi:hypothetical protein
MSNRIGQAHTGTIHRLSISGSTGAECNNRLGSRPIHLTKRADVTDERIAELRTQGARLCQRCFGKG